MANTLGVPELVLIITIAILVVLPASRICAKAGYPAWLGALALLPAANVVLAFFLAFAEWPMERTLKELRERGA